MIKIKYTKLNVMIPNENYPKYANYMNEIDFSKIKHNLQQL